MRVVQLLSNEYTTDPRVTRSLKTLVDAGHDVGIICLPDPKIPSRVPDIEGVHAYRLVRKLYFKDVAYVMHEKVQRVEDTVNLPIVSTMKMIVKSCAIAGHILYKNATILFQAFHIGADVYHANDLDTLFAGYIMAKIHGAELVYDSHELYMHQWDNMSPMVVRIMCALEGFVSRRAIVITVNDHIARTMYQWYHLNHIPIVVMNCSDTRVDAPTPSHKPVKIIYIGNYSFYRGLEPLVQSSRYFDDDMSLTFMGFGFAETTLRKLVEHEHISRVSFVHPVPMQDVVHVLRDYDIGVIPFPGTPLNNLYASPNKLFDYMSAGMAICCSRLPVIEDVIAKYHVGTTFDDTTPESMAEALIRLAHSADLNAIKKNALAAAENEYNNARQGFILASVYDSIAYRRSGGVGRDIDDINAPQHDMQ